MDESGSVGPLRIQHQPDRTEPMTSGQGVLGAGADWLDLDYRPALPADRNMGIGIVGAGEIVDACHLPAYRMGELHVAGIFDLNRERAQKLADKYGIPKV